MTALQPGTYICLRTGSIFGYLIRFFTSSDVDHAVMYLGGGLIAEATTRGVRVDQLTRYAGAYAVASTGEALTSAERETICATARSFAGRRYNWPAITAIALRRLGIRWAWLTRIADRAGAMICSELIAKSGLAVRLTSWLCGETDPAFVRPDQLAARPTVVQVII